VNAVRQRADFILSHQHHVYPADGRREMERLPFAEAARQAEPAIAHHPRSRYRFVKRALRRPLRDPVGALGAFIEPDIDALHLVHHLGRARRQQVGQPRGHPGRDDRGAALASKSVTVA
jgi:hypothetical protein